MKDHMKHHMKHHMEHQKHSNIHVFQHDQKYSGFSYYEYKYEVPHGGLEHVKSVLNEFCGNSDPYPWGVVDSIYYDTLDETILSQCLDGVASKNKFRIRGYGDGYYRQIHEKQKQLSSVSKYKSSILPVSAKHEHCPEWEYLRPKNDVDPQFFKIIHNARKHGALYPSIRVKYFRYRFRAYDYRITLDTNVEVFAPVNGLPRTISYAVLPHHVLEVKTTDLRPKLPFLGIIKLPQISFSKFMLGLRLLNGHL